MSHRQICTTHDLYLCVFLQMQHLIMAVYDQTHTHVKLGPPGLTLLVLFHILQTVTVSIQIHEFVAG